MPKIPKGSTTKGASIGPKTSKGAPGGKITMKGKTGKRKGKRGY